MHLRRTDTLDTDALLHLTLARLWLLSALLCTCTSVAVKLLRFCVLRPDMSSTEFLAPSSNFLRFGEISCARQISSVSVKLRASVKISCAFEKISPECKKFYRNARNLAGARNFTETQEIWRTQEISLERKKFDESKEFSGGHTGTQHAKTQQI